MLKIHNTLNHRKEPVGTPGGESIGLYVCGMTVYDHCHLGHARVLVVFDILVRYLDRLGIQVRHVRNVTDVDDRILNKARAEDTTPAIIAERFIRALDEDARALGVRRPDREPRATEYVGEMIDLISRLLARDHAYCCEGDVRYRVRSFPAYGALSGNRVHQLRQGTRAKKSEEAEDEHDFVLWKGAPPHEPGWDSPWGWGRPGWHIECSAMSMALLGEQFDIHGGGHDLVFPHHECEIAQGMAVTGKNPARIWMHSALVEQDGAKMAKSTGNRFTVRDALTRYSGETIRYSLLASHYRSPIVHTHKRLQESEQALRRLYRTLRDTAPGDGPAMANPDFNEAMDNDLNTPEALGSLHRLATEANGSGQGRDEHARQAARALRRDAAVLGLLQDDPDTVLHRSSGAQAGMTDREIEDKVQARKLARAARSFAEADAIRDELARNGIRIEDLGDETKWERTAEPATWTNRSP